MLDVDAVRSQFPALARTDAVFFDNPGGTQISRHSLDRLNSYLLDRNANHGGAFRTSIESDELLQEAHLAMADLLNARSPAEIIFGANMTTLTLAISRSLGRTFSPGDEIVVTRLDHDANIAPWLLLAEDRGLCIRWVDIREKDVSLDLDSLRGAITDRTRLVAFGYASNAVGTVNDVAAIAKMAHEAGAWCYVDAVQSVPHLLTDVQELDCDFLVCSAYKFFGPHAGVLYGKLDLLRALPAYKVRPATNELPGKFETGTQNHEGIAATLGAVEYLEWVGTAGPDPGSDSPTNRRSRIAKGMRAIRQYELQLQSQLIEGLQAIRGVRIWGITETKSLEKRVPTVSFTMEGCHPKELSRRLAEKSVYTWDGNYYALAVMERLGLEEKGGMLRVGLVHYNTAAEIELFLNCLAEQVAGCGKVDR